MLYLQRTLKRQNLTRLLKDSGLVPGECPLGLARIRGTRSEAKLLQLPVNVPWRGQTHRGASRSMGDFSLPAVL